MKYKSNQIQSQDLREKAPRQRLTDKFWYIPPNPCTPFRLKTRTFISKYPQRVCNLLNAIIGLTKKHRFVYMGQLALGRLAGYTGTDETIRCNVNKDLRILEMDGLVSNNYRHYTTSLYRVADLFRNQRVVKKLSSFLPALLLSISIFCTQSSKVYSSYNIYTSVGTTLSTKRSKKSVNDSSRVGTLLKSLKYDSSTMHGPLPVRPTPACSKRSKLEDKLARGRYTVRENGRAIREAIDKIRVIPLSLYGKSIIAIFPSKVINEAHDVVLGYLKNGMAIDNRFALLYSKCRDICIEKDLRPNYEILKRLTKKYSLSRDSNPLDLSQKALKKADNSTFAAQSGTKAQLYVFKRPARGPYSLSEGSVSQVGEKKTMLTMTSYQQDRPQEHELSINEILEKWLDKYRESMLSPIIKSIYPANFIKNMAAGAVVSAIRHQADYDLTRETKILIKMINSHQVPNAIGCKELMSEDEYFNIFVSRLQEIDARSSNYHSRTTYTAQAA